MATPSRLAIRIEAPGIAAIEKDGKHPNLDAGDILVRTTALALNPVDHANVDYMAQVGTVLGCDYAVGHQQHHFRLKRIPLSQSVEPHLE